MKTITVVVLLVLELSNCFAQSGGNFLIHNVDNNKCMSSSLEKLVTCDQYSDSQQFRWISKNRILNTFTKKCLGVGSKAEGKKLQWLKCEDDNVLQKWECPADTFLGLKNESLYLAVNNNGVPVISTNTGIKSKWTILGTVNNICSRPYEEMYTIKGNARGRPCQFPFLYENKWYADCTKDDEENQRLWCSVETDYSVNQLWGYCPTKDLREISFWFKHPMADVFYQLNGQSSLTWYQARKSCQQQGAELLSVSEPHEHTFISGIVQKTQGTLWTGLNKLDVSSGWQWSDGKPYRYLKWLSGFPTTQPGHSCGALRNSFGSEWANELCSKTHGYICQRVLSAPTTPPVVNTGFCQSPWIPYSGSCYLLHRNKRTWMEARDVCLREGGDLLSILNTEEQSFAITQLGYLKTDKLWIGFNDRKTQMLFEWSDQSSVTFASWEVGEPSHNAVHAEDCVLMRGEEGKWSDDICENKYGFICKKRTNSKASNNDTVVTNPGCKPGWTRYGYYCYMAGSETKTFEEAKHMCEKAESQLVDISSRIENAFLVSLVGSRPEKYFWTGLSNQKDLHTFEWTNTKRVPFTHFNAGMPGRKQGCVAMTTGITAGLWDVLSCSNKEKYICKQRADGLITTPAPTTHPALACPEEWTALASRDFCVKYFNVPSTLMKTWDEALDFCQELGGDLLSIHHESDVPWRAQGGGYPAWIGYRMYDPSVGYVWSDGSSSSYQSWASDEPNNMNNIENCVEMRISMWDEDGMWNDVNCHDKKDWYCQIRKGKTPKEVNITAPVYNETEDGWIEFRGGQYYASRYSAMSVHDARAFCKKSHGDLVVINDEEERLFLWYQAKWSHNEFIIGLTVDLDGSYQWMDGSPVVFQAWEANQPAFKNSEERCVKMTPTQGLWESINCGDEYNFFCKRSQSPPVNSTVAPPPKPKGGCAPEWENFEGKCYNMKEDKKTWTEARQYCREHGGDLSAITSRREQAFLTAMVRDKTTDLWIGFNNLVDGRFKWTDGSTVAFTDWAKGEPQNYRWHAFYWSKYQHSEEQECVAMGIGSGSSGKWVATDCNSTHGFICSRDVDPGITPVPVELPKTFVKLGNSSFKVIQENLTWSEANRRCEEEGAHLASIRDLITQAYLELQVFRAQQPMWIGLNSIKSNGYFVWVNNWPMTMEKWASSEPQSNRPCVYMETEGEWRTTLCNQTYYSICEQSTDIPPTLPAQHPGHCPQDQDDNTLKWIPFKDSCYAFVTDVKSWSRAARLCMTWGASLVSIRDEAEEKFIENNLMLLDSYKDFWIGLFQSQKGHWLWTDNSVVDYTNWGSENDYEDYFEEPSWNSDCALISTSSKKWKKHHCDYSVSPFICKTPKVITPTTKATYTVPEPHRVNTGLAVFFSIAVVCIVGALVYIYYRSSKRRLLSPIENPMYNKIEAAHSDSKDNKSLLSHIEISE